MSTATLLIIPQDRRTRIQHVQRAVYGYRYAYTPSAESQSNGEKGQDALILQEDGKRFIFAVCDGVSQSFFGDLAASFLASHIVQQLWHIPPANYTAFQTYIQRFLTTGQGISTHSAT